MNDFIPARSIQWASGKSERDSGFSYVAKLPSNSIVWRRDYAGLRLGEISRMDPLSKFYYVVIPYWMIALPTTLISAYLLVPLGKRIPLASHAPDESVTAADLMCDNSQCSTHAQRG